MYLALDVHYHQQGATVAGIGFTTWTDTSAQQVLISTVSTVAEYVSGQFYRRELPCLLALLSEHQLRPALIVIDGFVDLDQSGKAGLGRYLYQALDQTIPIIGVAKNAFAGVDPSCAVYRGQSERPLYVTCAGYDLEQAKQDVMRMAGEHRLPTLLKEVDRCCRQMMML
jgi:deoxyribonuclease V